VNGAGRNPGGGHGGRQHEEKWVTSCLFCLQAPHPQLFGKRVCLGDERQTRLPHALWSVGLVVVISFVCVRHAQSRPNSIVGHRVLCLAALPNPLQVSL
jgi:hypothetical protein